jgi:hypothetical protein
MIYLKSFNAVVNENITTAEQIELEKDSKEEKERDEKLDLEEIEKESEEGKSESEK